MGGWDPYNVTEDADLGIRLARAGWRTAVIDSATDEEAPRRAGTWLRQRSRWYKGWMQTLLVHWRRPRQLVHQVGWLGTFALTLMLGGGLASALMHPFFLAILLMGWWTDHGGARSMSAEILAGLGFSVFAIGYGAAVLSTVLGMQRRRIPGLWQVLPLIPVYWVLLSCAAWRALIQLILDPQRWEKTEHGLAQTSRRRRVRGGRLVVRRFTNNAADRRPRRRVHA